MVDQIYDVIRRGELPSERLPFLSYLLEDSEKFISQEGPVWDFKREWPFSYSDDFFCGIARLVCAFANSDGGIIVFGVHDTERTAGHNKVAPNMDRLQQALNQLLSEKPSLKLRRYETGTAEAVDVLLVSPHDASAMPLRFLKTVGDYKAGVIWVRQGHEVVAAEPRHIASLYCRIDRRGTGNQDDDGMLGGGLPPSPSTIRKFVGRIQTVDDVFRWLKLSDEPRNFLYGKGGSGKTTIAYEVARTLRLAGPQFRINGGETLDNVIFVSAKQQMLNVMSQTAEKFVGLDFSNERELYEAILALGSWTSESLSELTLAQLREEIRQFFDLTSNFLVIDDVDTLTTEGVEAGFDYLYGVLWRSKRKSRILYTLRNAPTHSLANAIEVPGLEAGDYEEFVKVCAAQFRVPVPDAGFVQSKLSAISERRPLVIESIVALARTAGSYKRAVELFEEGAGEDVRGYVFQREWNSLPADNHGRYVLAVLALHSDPVGFADIVALTRYETGRVRDALAAVREMFLQVAEVGEEATYQLGSLTRAFVFEQSKKLDQYPALKERVAKYRRSFFPDNPVLSRLRHRAETLISKGRRFNDKDALRQALALTVDKTLAPSVTEDPRFNSLQGFVCASQVPPKLDDARVYFGRAFAMKFEPDIDQITSWYFAERDSGHGLEQSLKIADFVSSGKTYDEDTKFVFLSRKATLLFNRGRENIHFDPSRGAQDLEAALNLHLVCYEKAFEGGSNRLNKVEEYARNSAFVLFQFFTGNHRRDDLFAAIVRILGGENLKFDPLEDPLGAAVSSLAGVRGTRAELQKCIGRLQQIAKLIGRETGWYDRFARERLVQQISSSVAELNRQVGALGRRN
ncbi:blr0871 [Bradyrhizobium diazoefficiens USDA 110]|uniref:Blr0871 protein n=1 Tax=Bradyrhizobium diazoefficiens (strain JCM 10833 / BCRC 13528 / IAM 13628 / NBRC 14792 / USDA 110) TaxID=224911 RepID=Q89W22_BRADU|nr:RNA-binding domain-containing protein [Bradyrhizobium diazoefficiens]AND86596.1 hypothetical protein AAV28_01205 [Bradyrhizobium diazoefficiens USDA 110]QBP19818.1 AAA family ATPase [Bradyrhizobium diazoefficiens]BAC46136.1 blr0871 [Bradyrhizobium diazoefficiens USDA 110]BCF40398.1 ATP-binding protein [Bradyrhizobium diazoefficiens]BCF66536.1 ATP-binding protein [Bradyrhizobium diazoefficiens]